MKQLSRLILCAATVLGLHTAASAALVSHTLSWTGAGGHSASGSFSYDDTTIGGDNLITQADLTAFTISFLDPGAVLLKTYTSLADAQVFAFHTDTGLIDQGPTINLILGQIGVTEYLLIRANGCTGNDMLLYQGNSSCPGTQVDRAGTLVAGPANGVPEPATIVLAGLALLGAGLRTASRRA